jgi:hypothetical protein
MSKKDITLREYYEYYLTLHQHPTCRLLHFIGQIFTIAFAWVTISNSLWYLIPLIPFVIYPFAWSGHAFFEKNRPAAFSSPIYAKISDWIMFKDILLGRLKVW